MNLIDIVKFLETKYPKELARDWDNVGLQIGSLNRKAGVVLVTLDVTKEVVKEAVAVKADLVVAHHPLLFKPLSSVATESPRGWMIEKLIRNDIALYAMHTNYDVAQGGMNDRLASLLGIRDPQLLDEDEGIGRYGAIDPTPMAECILRVKNVLGIESARFIGVLDRNVTVLGVSGGSGSNHVGQAKRKGCDLYVTGDVTYHTALDCLQMGLSVLDVGHYAEKIFRNAVADEIAAAFPDVKVVVSAVDTDPYVTL
jgi:dinuclear metal center YbgI/SA1388 family protein